MKLGKYTQLFHPPIDPDNVNDTLLGLLPGRLKKYIGVFDSSIDAGYTYFGQFVDHDLSFMQQTDLQPNRVRVRVEDLENRRRPNLDLDSIYGAGLDDSAVPFDHDSGRFIMGPTQSGQPLDLPRGKRFQAMIADPRNDENLLVGQMQVLFMRLHNKIVDDLALADPKEAFATARLEVVQLYQHVVLYDFANKLLPRNIYSEMIEKWQRKWEWRGRLRRRPGQDADALPIEFSTAVFRLHGMVREFYLLQSARPPQPPPPHVSLASLLTYQLTKEHQENNKLQDNFVVDWRLFLRDINQSSGRAAQRARKISPRLGFDVPAFVTTASEWKGQEKSDQKDNELIYHLKYNQHASLGDPKPGADPLHEQQPQARSFDLADRTLRRGHQLHLASAQQIVEILRHEHPDEAKDFGLTDYTPRFVPILYENTVWATHTPLWLYCMLEAWEHKAGDRLGILGGWILADTLLTAATSTRLPLNPDWKVTQSPVYNSLAARKLLQPTDGSLTLRHLIEFTYPQTNP